MLFQLRRLIQRVRKWLRGQRIILLALVLMTRLVFSNVTSNANSALDLAYEFQIGAIRTQTKYETKLEDLDEFKKIYKDQSDKQFWINISLILAAGYALGNSK